MRIVCYCEECKYNRDRECGYQGILEIDYKRGYSTNEYNPVCQQYEELEEE